MLNQIPTSNSEVTETRYVLQSKYQQKWSDIEEIKTLKAIPLRLDYYAQDLKYTTWRIIKRTIIESPLSVEEQNL